MTGAAESVQAQLRERYASLKRRVDSSGNPGSSQYDWGLRDFQSVAIDRCGMAHLAWTDDLGPGSTDTASQISGPSLLLGRRC